MSSLDELKKLNKAQLVSMVESMQAEIDRLTAELNAYKPDPNGRKLNNDKADEIRRLFISGVSKNQLSLKYQVSRDSIDAVLEGKIYKDNFMKFIDAIQARKAVIAQPAKKAK